MKGDEVRAPTLSEEIRSVVLGLEREVAAVTPAALV